MLGFVQVCSQLKVPPQMIICLGLGLSDTSKHHLYVPHIGDQSEVGLDNLGRSFPT